MFSEDIATFSAVFLEKKSFYQMLDSTDTEDDLVNSLIICILYNDKSVILIIERQMEC